MPDITRTFTSPMANGKNFQLLESISAADGADCREVRSETRSLQGQLRD